MSTPPLAWAGRLLWVATFLGASRGEEVLTLTGETFEATVTATPLILVQFFAPWCGHCKKLAPEYEGAAKVLKGRVPLAKVDATVETTLADQYKVEGYPTLYFFRSGVPQEYTGGREADNIVEWVEQQFGPPVKVLASAKELDAELKQRRSKIYFVAKGAQPLMEMIKGIAETHRQLGTYFHVESGDVHQVEVHRGVDEIAVLAGADVGDARKVLDFILAEMLPSFGEINEDNFEPYLAKSGKGIVWACFKPESFREDASHHKPAFRELAAAFPHLPVVYTDTKEYVEHVKEELGCVDFPTIVVQLGNLTARNETKRYRKVLLDGEITGQTLTSWVQGVLDGHVDEDDGLDELDEPDEEDEAGEDGDAGGAKTDL